MKTIGLAATITAFQVSGLRAQDQKAERPNIVLIMADDLGYEGLSCNGGQSYETPVLDQLAQTGVRFTHCYSQPLCTPSRVQIMTGKYNFRNYKMFGYLDPGQTTFGNILKESGYATCIAGKWQLGNGIEAPHHTGFDEYCLWQIYATRAGKDVRGPRYADPKVHVNGSVLEGTDGKYGPDVFVDFINDFITENKDKPFFVYYPMVLTHDPFVPTPASDEWETDRYKKDKSLFKDMVEYMDYSIGRIVEHLDELGIRDNTLIIFTGDNGSPRQITSLLNGNEIKGGKSYMTDAGTHVPLIANWPGTIPIGMVSDDLIDFSDFLPTLAEIGKAKIPQHLKPDGRSFYPQLTGTKGNPRDWVYVYYWGRGRDVFKTREFARDKQFKLYDDGSFFDVVNDPLELKPITDESHSIDMVKAKQKLSEVLKNIKSN